DRPQSASPAPWMRTDTPSCSRIVVLCDLCWYAVLSALSYKVPKSGGTCGSAQAKARCAFVGQFDTEHENTVALSAMLDGTAELCATLSLNHWAAARCTTPVSPEAGNVSVMGDAVLAVDYACAPILRSAICRRGYKVAPVVPVPSRASL